MNVLVDLCIVPLGVGVSLSSYIAACEKVLIDAGLKTSLHSYLFLPDGKKRLEDGLGAAEGTLAGRGEPVALAEDEAASTAFGRSHLQLAAAGVEAVADMFQVAVDLLFHEVCPDGYLPGGERLVKDELADGAAERLRCRARNGRLERERFQGTSWRIAVI